MEGNKRSEKYLTHSFITPLGRGSALGAIEESCLFILVYFLMPLSGVEYHLACALDQTLSPGFGSKASSFIRPRRAGCCTARGTVKSAPKRFTRYLQRESPQGDLHRLIFIAIGIAFLCVCVCVCVNLLSLFLPVGTVRSAAGLNVVFRLGSCGFVCTPQEQVIRPDRVAYLAP